MALTNNLKKQVDQPVWEWCRLAPGVSAAVSSATSANNSTYHVNHGRYIYYLQAATTVAGATSVGTGFWRYDTISDTYQQLAFPPIAPVTFSAMQFVGGQGYYGRVLSATGNTITAAALTGQILDSYDIRITSGTGMGQHRVIASVADPIIADNGTLTTLPVTPELSVIDANKNWTVNQWVGYQVRFVANTGNSIVRKILYNSSTTLYFSDAGKYAEELNAYAPIATIAGAALAIGAVGTQYQIESSIITVDTPWTTTPDATSKFIIHSGGIWLLSSGTSYTMQYYDVAADTWYVRNSCGAGAAGGPVFAAGTDGTIMNTGEIALIDDRGQATGTQSSTTLKDITKSWQVNYFSSLGHRIRIFSGTGQGQVRAIISNTVDTLTVSPAWTTTPDTTSLYIIDELDSGTVTGAANSNQTAVATSSTILGNIFTATTMSSGAFYAGQVLSGTGVMTATTVTTRMGACFTAGLTATIILAHGDTTGIVVGMVASIIPTTGGTGALSGVGSRVVSVTTNTITLSIAVTGAVANATLQFTTAYMSAQGATNNGNIITVGSTTDLVRGMIVTLVSGTGTIPVGTYVVDILNSTTFTISATPTVALSASAVVLGTPYQTIITNQISGVPGGAGTYYVWPAQTVTSTTITGTGIATLTDSSKIWPLHRWNGQSVRIIAGTGAGQVRSIVGTKDNNTVAYTSAAGAASVGTTITVTSVTSLAVGMQVTVTAGVGAFAWATTVVSIDTGANTFVVSAAPTTVLSGGATVISASNNNTIFVTPTWTTVPDSTSVYVIHGDSDKLYFSLATQTPTFVHNIESDTVTQSRMLEYGVARGVSAQYADHAPVAIASGVPVQPVTYAFGTATAYLSAAGATSTGTLVTVGTTAGLAIGTPITVSAGVGAFAAGSYVQVINSTTTFTVSATPTTPLSGGLSVVSGVASALVYFGMGPFLTTGFSASGGTVTITFTTYPGSSYTGTTTIPVGSLITTNGITTSGSFTNGDFVVTASSAGSVSFVNAGTGTQVLSGILSSGQKFNVGAASVTTGGSVPILYNAASVTTTAAGAGFVAFASAATGQLTTTGFIQHLPQATTACTISGSTATVTTTSTYFPIGSFVSVTGVTTLAGATSGSYNGIYQVTASSAGSCSFSIPSNTPTGTASVQGQIQAATLMQWVTTVNAHQFKAGVSITHKGDVHFGNSITNRVATIYPVTVPGTLNQYIYTTGTANYTSAAGATSSSTTITVGSTTGLSVGMLVYVTAGTGIFASGSYVVSITNSTTFVVSVAPATPLSGGASVVVGSLYTGTQIVYTQTSTVLTDCTKNWVPNQFANCLVNFNTTQGTGTGTNPTVLSAYVLSNTATQLIFVAAHTAPVQGITRYVITMPPSSQNNSVLGAVDSGLAVGAQATTQIQDTTKFWAMPTNVVGQVAATATAGASTITITATSGIFPGMVVIATAGTCTASTLTTTITVASISGLVVTLAGGTLGGTTGSTTFSFIAIATSSGTTVTLSGFTTQGLQVGMYLGVNSVDNIKNAQNNIVLPVYGALVQNGGTVLTNVQVTAVTSSTTFTISSAPTTALVNVNIFASFWFTNQWVGRRIRYTTGATLNYIEAVILTNTTTGIVTYANTVVVPVSGATGYAIFQQPNRGLGTAIFWNFGQSDQSKRGQYLLQSRGGGVTGFDRFNLQNDFWEFLTPTPNYEVLATGAMYAYDGGDRIYFTPQVTQRVYYFDIDKQQIHGGSQYPYLVGTAIVGNRMEIFTTADGLKYLWLNRHSFQECFRQLLFY
jgi:hypothetical protein